MNTRRVVVAFLLSLAMAAQASAAGSSSSTDQFVTDANGDTDVIRRSQWSDFNGASVAVDQLLKSDGFGRLIYRYDEQTEATKLYHQAICESVGMTPSSGEGIAGGSASGWACEGESAEGELGHQIAPKSVDWVTTTAPSGQVPVGISYHSTGQMRMQSSVGGQRRATVGVDNGRCTYTDVKHFSGAFTNSGQVFVACIVHQSRFVNTSMDVCIPRRCGSHRGTQFAR